MLRRVREAIEAGRSAVSDAEKTAEVSNLVALMVLDELGPMADDTRARHLDAVSASGKRALFILGPDAELEHASLKILCEFLPRSQDIALTTGQRADVILRYRLARLRQILDKWEVEECRWIGDQAAELVAAWNADPNAPLPPVRFLPAL